MTRAVSGPEESLGPGISELTVIPPLTIPELRLPHAGGVKLLAIFSILLNLLAIA